MTNYRILLVNTVASEKRSPAFYRSIIKGLSYEDVCQKYRDDGLVVASTWSNCMRQLGNESIDIYPSDLTVQKLWCEENGIVFDQCSDSIVPDILDAQIAKIKPDIIFFYCGAVHGGIGNHYIGQLKNKFRFLRLVTVFWGDYRPNRWYESLSNVIDIAFTNGKGYRDKMIASGIEAYENHPSFDSIVHNKININNIQPENDFIFVGQTGYQVGVHLQRYKNLKYLLEKTELKCWATEANAKSDNTVSWNKLKNLFQDNVREILVSRLAKVDKEFLKKTKRIISYNNGFSKLSKLIDTVLSGHDDYRPKQFPIFYRPLSKIYPSKVNSSFITNYYELLGSSKIIFNAHRDEPEDYSNIRVFEATGVGSCLITDKPDKVKEFFVPDEEILTYSNLDECIEKVKYALENDKFRKEIARKGQLKTMKNYTTMHHCEKVHEVLKRKV